LEAAGAADALRDLEEAAKTLPKKRKASVPKGEAG
jgi:hypothetical protein